MSSLEEVIARICPEQYGLVTRSQLLDASVPTRSIHHFVATRRLERVHAGVYRVSGVPRSWLQDVLAGTMSCGPRAAASGPTAVRLLGLDERNESQIEITVPFTSHPKPDGFTVHRSRRLFVAVRVRGIPTMPAARTLQDVARLVPTGVLEELVDKALHRRLLSLADLADGPRCLADLARRRDGSPPESVLETRFLQILRKARLPVPIGQFEVRRGAMLVGRVDFAYPEQRIAVELDGYEFRPGRTAFDRGKLRDNELQAAGYVLLHFTSTNLKRPSYVVSSVRRLLWERGHPDVVSL
jgi:very-short-patch-repair endonuclease